MGRLLFVGLLVLLLTFSGLAMAQTAGPELIIIVVNHVGWDDLAAAKSPHLQQMLREGAVGLMNVKNYSGYLPSSSFLTIGMSNRTKLDDQSLGAFNRYEKMPMLPEIRGGQFFTQLTGEPARGEVVVPEIARYRKMARELDPSAQPGTLGQLLTDNNLRVAVYGNSDVLEQYHREAALLVMDTAGRVARGDVGAGILRRNSKAPFGVSTDSKAIIRQIRKYKQPSQVVLVETGDTSRLEYKNELFDSAVLKVRRKEAIEGFEPLFRDLLALNPRYILLMGANVNTEMIKAGNTGLVPILLYGAGQGILCSESTRREGYITNLDLLPTVASLLKLKTSAPTKGFPVVVQPSMKGIQYLISEEVFYRNLRNVRYGITDTMVVIYIIALLLGIIGLWQGYNPNWAKCYQGVIIALFLLPLGLTFGGFLGYAPIWPMVLVSLLFCGGISYLLVRYLPIRKALSYVTIAVPLLFLLDALAGGQWMMRSPLGSDVIAGGRFYGMGNDLMGVVLGSLLTAIAFWGAESQKLRQTARWWAPSLLLFATIGIGFPSFGANVGGMITALMVCMTTTLLLHEFNLSLRKVVLLVVGVIAAVVIVAAMDAFYNPQPTHAGRAILALMNQGTAGFIQIVSVKLKILGGTIRNSAWTWLFVLEILALLTVRFICPGYLKGLKEHAPFWHLMGKPLGAACFFALAVNDTGIIPAAIILSYFWFAGFVLHFEGIYHGETLPTPTQGVTMQSSPSTSVNG